MNPKNIIIATLAAIVIIDEAVIIPINNRRFAKQLEKKNEMIHYLASICDRNGVELTEFDKIAMTNL